MANIKIFDNLKDAINLKKCLHRHKITNTKLIDIDDEFISKHIDILSKNYSNIFYICACKYAIIF